ncbi:protease inhibitor I42 family protein [Actinophytocola sp. NPDC049390]|uniref:protease inhibitor I42 family protein n=1 Tax=Actinophytocola sp. NPDC049390 TaxID=3363894 RepID=UPI0037A700D6
MITASVGGTVNLALPENPTTGYRWRLTGPLEVVSDEFFPSGTTPGAAGERVFVLRVVRAGRHEVLAELTRPWEARVKDVRTFVVEAS